MADYLEEIDKGLVKVLDENEIDCKNILPKR